MTRLSLIFVGTGDFGLPVLEALLKDRNFRIPFVITGQDKPAARHLKLTSPKIKELAQTNKLIVHQPRRISALKQKITQENPNLLLVVSYGEIIAKEILNIPKLGAINIHASLLPLYRGASPIQEALRNSDKKTGITWILMDEKMDAGQIIEKCESAIGADDNFATLSKKLSELAAAKTPGVLMDFAKNRASEPQEESKATYCRKIKKEDGLILLEKETAEEIVNKIRAFTPWPGCYIFWNNKRLKIIQARIVEQKISPGEMKVLDNGILAFGTQKGVLLPVRVQLEGKKEMRVEEFLRGQRRITNNEIRMTN